MTTARSVRATAARVAIVTGMGLAAAALCAGLAFTLSAGPAPLQTNGCGPEDLIQSAGFNPWTGQPQGRVVVVDCLGRPMTFSDPVPADIDGHRGIPWASLLTIVGGLLGVFVGIRWPARRRNPDPASPDIPDTER